MVVGTPRGIQVLEVREDGLRSAGEHRFENLRRVLWSEGVGADHEFVLEGSDGTALADVSDPNEVAVLGHYPEGLEHASLAKPGSTILVIDRASSRLRVFKLGRTAWL